MANPVIIPSGGLDPTFSADGRLTTPLAAGDDLASGVAVQPDGKILVGGTSAGDFALVRYNSDGSLDTSFSSDGIATASPGTGVDTAKAIALLSNGKVLVAGTSNSGATDDDFALVRFNADGTLDATFGDGGKVVATIPSVSADKDAFAMAIQPDGKIVVVSDDGLDFVVLRFTINGTLDTSFDGDGFAITSIENSSDFAQTVVIQSDGKILVGGYGYNPTGDTWNATVVRYNANGTLDTSFDGDGRASIDLGSDEFIHAMSLDAQGRILLAGELQPISSGSDMLLLRLTSAGALDLSFGGGDGVSLKDFSGGSDAANAVAVEADGKIVIAGNNSVGVHQAVVLRYDANGSLDTSFDGDGIFTATYSSGTSAIDALAFTPNGELVAAGSSFNGSDRDFGVLRLGASGGSLTANAGAAFSFTVPAATFFDADGNALALSATLLGGGSLPAWLSFNSGTRTFSGTPAANDFGTLLIQVSASDGSGTATTIYQLDSTSTMIQTLLPAGEPRWNDGVTRGSGASVTYSFMTVAPAYTTDPNESGTFEAFSAAQKTAAAQVLGVYAGIANISFAEVADTGDGGQLRFGRNSQPGSTSGYARFPGAIPSAGDVWIDKTETFNTLPVIGDYGYEVLVHEIGHALGLKHPFEGTPTLPVIEDTRLNTVMSYTDAPNRFFLIVTDTGGGGFSWTYEPINPETPMVYDIAAIQYLYGANNSFHSGDDTYSFDPADPFFKTIWDGGGNDTISITNFTNGSTIDLRDGHYSSIRVNVASLPPGASDSQTDVYDGSNNLGIAFDAIIENAIGGAGADQLIGNAVANTLQGGAGNDTLSGGAGGDIFSFAASGNGLDTITDFAAGDRVRVTSTALNGVITSGNGSGVAQNAVQFQASGGVTTLFIGTDAAPGADLQIALTGSLQPGALRVLGSDILANTAPTAGSFASTSAGLGQAVSLNLGSLFTDVDVGDSLNFTASGLPAGLSITSAGQITGTPTVAGLSHITMTGTDSGGAAANLAFDLTIASGQSVTASAITRAGAPLPGVTAHELNGNTQTGNHFDMGTSGQLSAIFSGSNLALSLSRSTADLQINGAPKPITAADALDALKLSVGLAASKGNSWKELIAADINHNGVVTAADALEILKASVGINTVQLSWVFVPTDPTFNPGLNSMTKSTVTYMNKIDISAITGSTLSSVTGILVGDVNNSWVIPA